MTRVIENNLSQHHDLLPHQQVSTMTHYPSHLLMKLHPRTPRSLEAACLLHKELFNPPRPPLTSSDRPSQSSRPLIPSTTSSSLHFLPPPSLLPLSSSLHFPPPPSLLPPSSRLTCMSGTLLKQY
eukprot:681849-Hanusia_phi.AAC.1